MAETLPLMPPLRRIGRYEIRGRLATGATADVFLARAEGAPDVALKRLHPHLADDADAVAQLLDEARLAALLEHPAAVAVLDVGCDEGAWFVAFEHVPGHDLGAVLARLAAGCERLPAPLAAAIVADLASWLGALHQLGAGLVHGDVAPANVLLSSAGAVHVVDLGACAAIARGAPGVFGTPGYVAPEQAAGEPPAPAADVFSAGAILFELLTGTPAFPHDVLTGLAAPVEEAAVDMLQARPEVSAALAAVVMRALAPDPRRRFASAAQLEDALRPFAAAPAEARSLVLGMLSRLFGA
jgi:serine/threonine-protein kinase